jgi:LPS export ABC transporter permease LptG
VAREVLLPAGFALLGLTGVVLTRDIVGLLPLMNSGVDGSSIAMVAFYKAIPLGATMLPFALLVGSLVALGRLGADREILVLEASGVAAWHLLGPITALAALATGVALAASLALAPWASRAQDRALDRISRERPWAEIRPGAVNEFGGWQLEAREVLEGGARLRGVLLFSPDLGETVFALDGRITPGGEGSFSLRLGAGTVLPSARGTAKLLRFEALAAELPASESLLARPDREELQGLSQGELRARAASFAPAEGALRNDAAIELQRRFALPLATLVFGFLAVPLFLSRSSFSRAGGGVMGILATIAYYGLVQLGEGLVQRGDLGVAAGVWLPNAALALLAAALLWRTTREGVLGQAFDRPQRSVRALAREDARRQHGPRPWSLPRYVARVFLQLTALSFAVIFAAYLLIDLMERLSWFSKYEASGVAVLRFYGARVWLLASRAVPMALLVGTSLCVSLLAAGGELMGMRACGIPAPRATLPALVLSAALAPLYFALNNVVVPRTNALADLLKRTEIKGLPESSRERAGVWYRSGNQVVEAALLDTQRGVASEIAIYELGEDGLPVSRTDARSAQLVNEQTGLWKLDDPARIEVAEGSVRAVPAPKYAHLGEALPAEIDTMHLSVAGLGRLIEEVEADGVDATELRVDYHAKLAEPLACLVLPAAILFFAVGGPPFPGPAQTLLVSAVLGVSYILLNGVAASIGYGKTLPPGPAAWSPTLLYASLAGFFGWRLWRRL